MKHTTEVIKTSGGVQVLLINIGGHAAVDIEIATRSGYRFAAKDNVEQLECPHVLEHLVFEGSKKYDSYDELQDIFTADGGSCNGVTNAYTTSYLFHTKPQHISKVLEAAIDVVYRPSLAQDRFAEELQVIRNELTDNLSNLASNAMMYTARQILPGLPYSSDLQLDLLDNVTLDEVKKYHRNYYSQRNTDMIIAADFNKCSKKELIELLETLLKDVPKGKRHEFPKLDVESPAGGCFPIQIGKHVTDSIVAMSFAREGAYNRRTMMCLSIFATMATSMKSYSVTYALRKRGYLYSFDFSPSCSNEVFGFDLCINATNDRLTGAVGYALEELVRIAKEGVGEKQFASVMKDVEGGVDEVLSSPESIIGWYSPEFIMQGEIVSPAQEVKTLATITQEEVLMAARSVLAYENLYDTVFSARSKRAAVAVDDITKLVMVKNTPLQQRHIDDAQIMLARNPSRFTRIYGGLTILLGLVIAAPLLNIGITQDTIAEAFIGIVGWAALIVPIWMIGMLIVAFSADEREVLKQAASTAGFYAVIATIVPAKDAKKLYDIANSNNDLVSLHFWGVTMLMMVLIVMGVIAAIQWWSGTRRERKKRVV